MDVREQDINRELAGMDENNFENKEQKNIQ